MTRIYKSLLTISLIGFICALNFREVLNATVSGTSDVKKSNDVLSSAPEKSNYTHIESNSWFRSPVHVLMIIALSVIAIIVIQNHRYSLVVRLMYFSFLLSLRCAKIVIICCIYFHCRRMKRSRDEREYFVKAMKEDEPEKKSFEDPFKYPYGPSSDEEEEEDTLFTI